MRRLYSLLIYLAVPFAFTATIGPQELHRQS